MRGQHGLGQGATPDGAVGLVVGAGLSGAGAGLGANELFGPAGGLAKPVPPVVPSGVGDGVIGVKPGAGVVVGAGLKGVKPGLGLGANGLETGAGAGAGPALPSRLSAAGILSF